MSGDNGNGGTVKVRRVDFYPADWLNGVAGLSAVERGVYSTLVMQMYSHQEPIDRDDALLARQMPDTHWRTVKGATDKLIKLGKIILIAPSEGSQEGFKLWSTRVSSELQKALKRSSSAAENGRKGGRASHDVNDLTEPGANRAVSGSLKLSSSSSSSTSESSTNPVRDSTPRAPARPALLVRLIDACQNRVADGPGIDDLSPIMELIAEGVSVDHDIVPALGELVPALSKPLRTWRAPFVLAAIRDYHAERLKAGGPTTPANVARQERVWRYMLEQFFDQRNWYDGWGPEPGEEGCRVPRELIDDEAKKRGKTRKKAAI